MRRFRVAGRRRAEQHRPRRAGFGEMLQNVMGDMTKSTKAAETQMTGAIQGQGNMIDVVTSVSSAEASLETVIAVRDQVIQAYQEIMRMPI
jgi:flagellar hook-basal body complex protein FliE